MEKKLTQQEILVRKELSKIYPQLKINADKTCGYNADRWADDLLALSITYYLEKPIETQIKIINDKKLENYITFIMGTQLKSTSSKFYSHYRKFRNNQRILYDNIKYKHPVSDFDTPFQDEDSEVMTCIKHHMESLDVYEKMLIQKHVIEGISYKDIAKIYDMPYSSVARNGKDLLKKLKNLCKHLI